MVGTLRAAFAAAVVATGLLAVTNALAAPKAPYTVAVTPSSASAGSTGNRLSFALTATASVQDLVSVTVPAVAAGSAWSKPQSGNSSAAGYVSAAKGTCKSVAVQGVSGPAGGPWTVVVNAKCSKGKSFSLTYGGSGGGGTTAATKSGAYTFTTMARAGGSFLNVAVQPVVTVTPRATAGLLVAGLSDAQAGTSQALSVTAQDQYGNTTPGYRGTVNFSDAMLTIDLQGFLVPVAPTIPQPYTFTSNDQGRHSFSGVVLTEAEQQMLSATDTVTSSITGYQIVTISNAAASKLGITGLAAGAAGTSQSVTVDAYDQYNNVARNYAGQISFSVTGPPPTKPGSTDQSTVPQPYPFTPSDLGEHAFTGVALTTAGNQTLTATDSVTSSIAGSKTVSITAGGPISIALTPMPSQVVAPAGLFTHQSPTVTAYDSYGNVATTDFTYTADFSVNLQYPPGVTCTRLICALSSAGSQFQNGVADGTVAYFDPPGAQITISASLNHNGIEDASTTVSQTISYSSVDPAANAIVIPNPSIPFTYDLQVTINQNIYLVDPNLTIANVVLTNGSVDIQATGTIVGSLAPITISLQATTPVTTDNATLTDALPEIGDPITVTSFVGAAPTYCASPADPCAGISASAPVAVWQPVNQTPNPVASMMTNILNLGPA